jgi:hypothetical protein
LASNTKWTHEGTFQVGGAHPLPEKWAEPYQNINFLAQSDGTLFLAGMRGFETDNHVDLFRLSDGPVLQYVMSKPVHTDTASASFRAGAGLYVTPAGRLALYAVQKANNATSKKVVIEEFTA